MKYTVLYTVYVVKYFYRLYLLNKISNFPVWEPSTPCYDSRGG
jgi:hypothetical protein